MNGTSAGANLAGAIARLKCFVKSSLPILWALAWVAAEFAAGAEPVANSRFLLKALPLPEAHGMVSLDYFIYDRARRRLWVPASNTGKLDVIDTVTDQITPVGGFLTATVDFAGKRPIMGPSSVSLGDGVVYVGDRGDSTICVIEANTLKVGECTLIGSSAEGLAAAPDALSYVATTHELWVTRGVPPMGVGSSDHSITILDASVPTHLKPKTKIALSASAEGFAVDNQRGRFYTNLEETGETLAIDVRRHSIAERWHSGCDEPHGLALDAVRGFLFVACSGRVVSLDVAHNGRVLGAVDTGAGVDNIDYQGSKHLLYAAASEVARLTVARVDEHGMPTAVAIVPVVKGARGVIVDDEGRAFVMDPLNGRILKITLHTY